ncbi:murein hydrolase activator EnvC family protein [Enterococcus cecorum]|uniref:murein hydrolase activator EnvC family protein n=1 Tax=Enterococcus cecorum TaxID=44008 RepID=UPI001FAC7424|nr:peptidoglycan DD-metalloendopeptidase family protein [Enterococcus cecorum]MCJ0537956.1 peptidoglycan DD-metalloendopeptidase family protein [Enterococcus cecorum]MCJ0545592.1 peptidoglycan DD-metalloendopeptidase family protein [Enterococcus cecorum]MCJ0551412.1 peptidoglycan DD-metalloendopeptidase family protein [Enterococcus cecorum]MCJ0569552.1 peptidoglycan DD-metalloendopeptidase family protein [Enterococcus cecorum]
MKKKLLLSGLLVLNFFATPLALAETIDENIQNQTKKIENLQADQKKLAQEVEQLNKNIKKYQTKYDETLAQKNEAEVKVNELTKKSVELQEKIEKRSEKIRDLARSTQLNQKSDTVLSALLEAKSVGDLVNKSFAIFTFVQANQNLLAQQEADQKELQKTKEQAEQNLQTINDSIADLQKTNEQLVNAKLDLNVKQNELDASLASEQAKKDEFIKQKEAAEKARQEAAAKLKAQQEAAARAQQEAAKHAEQQASSQTSTLTTNVPQSRPVSSSGWNAPLASLNVSSGFGPRQDPTGFSGTQHDGIDLTGSYGTPVFASRSGSIASSGYDPSAGNYIIINHGDGYYSYYLHLSSIVVGGGSVSAGQTIGLMGTTGNSTGVHLHFGIATTPNWRGFVNPAPYIGL